MNAGCREISHHLWIVSPVNAKFAPFVSSSDRQHLPQSTFLHLSRQLQEHIRADCVKCPYGYPRFFRRCMYHSSRQKNPFRWGIEKTLTNAECTIEGCGQILLAAKIIDRRSPIWLYRGPLFLAYVIWTEKIGGSPDSRRPLFGLPYIH